MNELLSPHLLTDLVRRAIIHMQLNFLTRMFSQKVCYSIMMKRLQGRNLAHPGCLIGVTSGLTVGIILAGVLAAGFNVALNTVLLVWLAITIVPGAIGWIIGDRLTAKYKRLAQEEQVSGGESSTVS